MTEAKPLPHQIPPEGEWDLWTIFGDRAAGKTWAAMTLAERWARDLVESRRGWRPSRTAIFVREVGVAFDQIVYGAVGIIERQKKHGGMEIKVERSRNMVIFENGAEWRFLPYSDPDRIRAWMPDNAWLEDSHLARLDELDAVMTVLHQEMKWGKNPKIVMTCNRLPPWPCHMLAGGRNHLTVAGLATLNKTLPEPFLNRLLEQPLRGGAR